MKNYTKQTLFTSLVFISCMCVAPVAASAEAGDGVQGENFVLKLSAGAGTTFNSNLFYQDDDPTSALAAVLTPGLSLASVKTDKVALSLDWGLALTQYLSGSSVLRSQSGISTDLGAAAHFNQAGGVSLRLEENLQRTNEAPSAPNARTINRFNNQVGGILGIHPGGRVLQGYLSYHWRSLNFNNPDINFSQANRDEHALQGRFVWQFRPRTAANLTANYTLVNYDQPQRVVSGVSYPNINTRPLRLTAGLNGLILRNLGAELTAGYGRAIYSTGPSFNSFIGRAALSYYIQSNANNSVTLAYDRSFNDSIIGNYYLSNRGDLIYTQPLIGERLGLELGAFYNRQTYHIIPQQGTTTNGSSVAIPEVVTDNRFGGGLGLGFTPLKWLNIKGGYQLNANASNDNVTITGVSQNGNVIVSGRGYMQHIVNASVTATY